MFVNMLGESFCWDFALLPLLLQFCGSQTAPDIYHIRLWTEGSLQSSNCHLTLHPPPPNNSPQLAIIWACVCVFGGGGGLEKVCWGSLSSAPPPQPHPLSELTSLTKNRGKNKTLINRTATKNPPPTPPPPHTHTHTLSHQLSTNEDKFGKWNCTCKPCRADGSERRETGRRGDKAEHGGHNVWDRDRLGLPQAPRLTRTHTYLRAKRTLLLTSYLAWRICIYNM